jgi:hypothetical protein
MIYGSIEGIQEAQEANLRTIAALRPSGAYGNAIRMIITQLHRYKTTIIHVDTGALRASQRIEQVGLKARSWIDEDAINPRTGDRPAVYGALEEARGGSHAFGARTVDEAAPQIVNTALNYLVRSMR